MTEDRAHSSEVAPAADDHQAAVHRIELLSVLLIALTSVLTAWAAFQATKWNGQMSIRFNQGSAARTESVRMSNLADRQLTVDVSVMTSFAEAVARGDVELAEFYQERFPEHLAVAVDAWIATDPVNSDDAPASPFEMDEYRLEASEEADRLAQRAEQLARQAEQAGARGDRYVMTAVMFSTVILMAALAVKVSKIRLQWTMLGSAGALLLAITAVIATFPVKL